MATNTFALIKTYTIGSGGTSSINFTAIPSTFTDLCLKVSLRTNNALDNFENVKLTFNNSSGGTAYSDLLIYGNGSTVATASNSTQAQTYFQYADAGTSTSSTFSNVDFYLPNYSGASYKNLIVNSVTENNSSAANGVIISIAAEIYSSTTAINQITLKPNVGTLFVQYSSASLYGILKA